MSQSWMMDLNRLCNENPFRKKIVVADRYEQGEQWLNRLCREYGPIMNTEVETIKSFVLKHTKPELAKRGLTLLSNEQTFWLVNNIMMDIAQQHAHYVPLEMLTPGIVHSFHHAVLELREAGLTSVDLTIDKFENVQKGMYMTDLLKAYEERLSEKRLTDFAGLLSCLPEASRKNDDLVIIRDMELYSFVEREMLIRIAGPILHVLKDTVMFPESILTGREPRMFQAAGSLAEIREVLRRISGEGVPFDQVEVVLSDYQIYGPAIYTITQALDIPCTMSQGVSVTFTQAGKAAQAYLEWLASNYNVDHLLNGLRHGFISFRHGGEPMISTQALIRTLEQSGIGWGRDRYELLSTAAAEDSDEAASLLGDIFSSLFDELPSEETWRPLEVLRALVRFLERCTKVTSEEDAWVISALQDQEDRLALVTPQSVSNESSLRYVKDIVSGIRVRNAGPKSGNIHVSSLRDGGESGRSHTFIVGMNEDAWSVQTSQDPVLLDTERTKLGRLLTSTQLASQKVQARKARLGKISGSVTLSFSVYNPVDQKTENAAFELLQVCRAVSGQPHMDFSAMNGYLGAPIGYVTVSDQEKSPALDSSDRWLRRLTDDEHRLKDGQDTLIKSYSFAAKSHHAALQVANPALSGHDGLLDTSTFAIRYSSGSADTFLSVTQLERYAECPRKFFYSSILKVREKDTAVFNRTQWLDAADRGSLLHEIFFLYLKEAVSLTNDGFPRHDQDRLFAITDQTLQDYQAKIPPPSPHIFQKEADAIRQDVAVFYKVEQARRTKPKYFELELAEGGEPLQVTLENGLVIRLKGFVDRVDEIRSHEYKIFDYKTGRPSKYDELEYFTQGTQLQHALYAEAVEQWLRKSGIDPDARVTESAYYFPTERGKGEEVSRIQNRRADLANLLTNMLDAIESGVYVPIADSKRCSWCAYLEVCGSRAEQSAEKWDIECNDTILRSMKEVARYA